MKSKVLDLGSSKMISVWLNREDSLFNLVLEGALLQDGRRLISRRVGTGQKVEPQIGIHNKVSFTKGTPFNRRHRSQG